MVLCYFDFGGMYTEFLIFLGGGRSRWDQSKKGMGHLPVPKERKIGIPPSIWLFMIPSLSYQSKLVYI